MKNAFFIFFLFLKFSVFFSINYMRKKFFLKKEHYDCSLELNITYEKS